MSSRSERRRALLEDAALAAAAVALIWIGAMGFGRTLQAQDEPAGHAAKPVFSPAVEQKLDQAIQNDAVILDRFKAIMDEVDIVKIRALRRPQSP